MSPRARAAVRRGLTVVAAGVTVLVLLLLVATVQDDRAITSHEGRAIANVLSAGARSAAVSFTTPDGETHVPPNGVLFPTGLASGQRVDVEYDTANPDLVRVAGRGWVLALLPTGTVLLITAALTLALRRLLRPRPTYVETETRTGAHT